MKIRVHLFILHFIFVSLIISSCNNKYNDGIIIQDHEALDSIIDQCIENGSYPFIYVRLENSDGSLIYEHGAINNELLPDRKVDKDTWFRIWSMSKIVTIAITLDLIEDGILKLNDPVTKYIPEFENLRVANSISGKNLSEAAKNQEEELCPYILVDMDSVMTVLHLINHQAGFYYATNNIPCIDSLFASKNFVVSKNTQSFIDTLATLPLVQQPGSDSHYGINTTVLGFVAERATGKSLKQLVKERITEPMNIKGLQYSLPSGIELIPPTYGKESSLRPAHRGELNIFGPDVPDYDPNHELYLGGEGMVATADDYADFVRMLLQKGTLNGYRFLNESTIEDIYAPHTQLDNPYGYNGYNLWVSGDSMLINDQGDKGLWMGGGYEGTHFWADPKRDFVGVIMSQIFWIPVHGYPCYDAIRGNIYKQIFEHESNN